MEKDFKNIDELFELWLLDNVTKEMVEDFMSEKMNDIEDYYYNETELAEDTIAEIIDNLETHLKNKYACILTDKQVEEMNATNKGA